MRARPLLLSSLVVLASVLGWSSGALAAPPTPLPPGQPTTFPGGTLCSFPVLIGPVTGKTKTIALPRGRTLTIAPGQTVTLTNLATGKSVRLTITGSFLNLPPDEQGNVTTLARGSNLLFDPVAGFVLVHGNFRFATGPDNTNVVPLSGEGSVNDVCQLLS
jgi:hypothetical protein